MSFNLTQAEFDLWAATYDADAASRAAWVSHEKVAQAIGIHKPTGPVTHVVDLGTGTGLLLPYLKKEFAAATLTGVDLSVKMIEECRKKGLADRLIQHDLAAGDWPIEPQSAQLISASGVLEFVRDGDAFIGNAAVILQKDGMAVMTYQLPLMGKRPGMSASPIYNHLPRDITDSFEKAGLNILAHTDFAAYRHYGAPVYYGLVAAQKMI